MEEDFHRSVPGTEKSGGNGLFETTFIKTVSPTMMVVEELISELAHSCVPVLLLGEKGTGKRTIAERIHHATGANDATFCVEPCSGLNREKVHPLLSQASTLYFEEICDLSVECQEFLLEALAGKNGHGANPHTVRFIAGSSQDVEANVRSGAFREDLYYRLSGVCLRVPPLRQRKEDIPGLVDFFLERYSRSFGRPAPPLSPATRELFTTYSWPGNLSELESAARAIVAVGNESVAMGGLRSLLTRTQSTKDGLRISLKDAARAASREAEKELILKALNRTRWNRRRAAQELQISYKALLYKLKQIGYSEYGAT